MQKKQNWCKWKNTISLITEEDIIEEKINIRLFRISSTTFITKKESLGNVYAAENRFVGQKINKLKRKEIPNYVIRKYSNKTPIEENNKQCRIVKSLWIKGNRKKRNMKTKTWLERCLQWPSMKKDRYGHEGQKKVKNIYLQAESQPLWSYS